MTYTVRFISLIVLAALSFVGCKDDDETKTGTLTGNVIFHGHWPDSGAVQLSIFDNWDTDPCSWCGVAPGGPPAYYTTSTYFQDPNTNNGAGPDTVSFTIDGITLGRYSAVAVGWRAPQVSDINCDEPTIGLYGAEWGTSDSLPLDVQFTNDNPVIDLNVNAYFDILPIAGCNERGRIDGVARVDGTWPAEGLLVMLTTFPVSGWNPIMGQPTAYWIMETPADSQFIFNPPYGTYYLSIWTNAAPPSPSQWYGSYGIDTRPRAGHSAVADAHPDAITLSESSLAASDLVVEGQSPAPHYISGDVNFSGTRPMDGLLVMITTQPVSPEQPPTGQPYGYFLLTDPNATLYAFTGMPDGNYYISLWNNVQGPGSVCYGAYGYTQSSDPDPDPIVLDGTNYGRTDVDVSNPAPHSISGVARVDGSWPAEGLLVMLTSFPVSGWHPVTGAPVAYFIMPTAADSQFYFDTPNGDYYFSLWTNAQPPAAVQWYGSYGIDTYLRSGHPVGTDPEPDAVTISNSTPIVSGVVIPGNSPAPHYVSGDVNFTGTRPAEGLLVMVTTQPVSPEQPPTGQPFGYFALTDPNAVLYAICGMPEGTYYVSLWNNVQGPGSVCYGAYGYTQGSDPNPDPIVLSSTTWGVTGIDVSGQP